jgi:hypothetical protein
MMASPAAGFAPNNDALNNAAQPEWLEAVKGFAEVWEAILTGLAIVVGGIWTYLLVVRKREVIPRAEVTHEIIQQPLAGGRRLLHVFTRVSNCSQVLLTLVSGVCRVQQVLPVPEEFAKAIELGKDPVPLGESEFAWPLLSERDFQWQDCPRELEPDEIDEILCDFVIDADAKVVEVYTYLKNKKKKRREIGWHLTTFYDLQSKGVLKQRVPESPPSRTRARTSKGETT